MTGERKREMQSERVCDVFSFGVSERLRGEEF